MFIGKWEYAAALALQEATPFKDGNITIHSFLNSKNLFKCMDININRLWSAILFVSIGLTTLFNIHIFPTEFIFRH
jgi:hypothetical protein